MVVYQSRWGHSRKIGECITRGLMSSGHDVMLTSVMHAPAPDSRFDFVILGGSTRMGRAGGQIKRYARSISGSGFAGKHFATFGTGATVPGENERRQASGQLFEILREQGLLPLAPPFNAGVSDASGFIAESEENRAEAFGRELGDLLRARALAAARDTGALQ